MRKVWNDTQRTYGNAFPVLVGGRVIRPSVAVHTQNPITDNLVHPGVLSGVMPETPAPPRRPSAVQAPSPAPLVPEVPVLVESVQPQPAVRSRKRKVRKKA